MSAITAKASRKMKKYAVLTREPRCFLGSFDFSWEQRKFSDITFPAGEKNKDNLPLESYSITNEHGFVPQDEKFENGGTMREADKRMYYIVSPKSFAYNPARINVGSIGYQNIGKNVIVSSLYEVFKTSEDVDDRLLWHWFKSPDFQKLIMQLQEGGVRLYFYYDKLCMGEVSLPSLEEQRKIGKLFDTLDNLITLHQRKCANLCSPSQVVFSLLFATSTFSWEQRKLGELCNITTGKLDANAMVSDGQYDFYTSGIDVFKIDVAAFEGPAITIAGNGASVGYMHLADGKFNAYQRTYVLTDFLADRQFLNVAIGNELPNKIQEEVRGSGIPYIVLNMLTDLAIPFPSHEEQYAIGVYFQQLDNLITLHQRKPFLMKWRTSDANRNQTNGLVL